MQHHLSPVRAWIIGVAVFLIAAALAAPPPALADHGTPTAQSFTFLDPAFDQEIVGVDPGFMGGVAFAADGDPLVTPCVFGGGGLRRFDLQGTAPAENDTTLHPVTSTPSSAGCGITNHPDGRVYSNTGGGVTVLNPETGALLATMGPSGNALGITVDPQTRHIVYVGSGCGSNSCTIHDLDPVTGNSSPLASLASPDAGFLDGIFFSPSGNHLFLANRTPTFRLTVLDRTGAVVQHVPMSSEPDGIAFKTTDPQFVVSNNLDGTLTRFDFPFNDFTQVPTQSQLASGGFRGDLSQVGPDSCLYLTQDGTRFNNGVTSFENSLVRICPGFSPPPGVAPTVMFATASADVGEDVGDATIQVTLSAASGAPVTVSYATADGSAINPDDYLAVIEELTIPAGDTSASFQIPIADDTDVEGTEELTLTLSSPSGATLGSPSSMTLRILDNDTAGGPTCEGRAATIVGSGIGATITGTPGDDVIVGTSGDDTISAGDGNDIVCAGPGNDIVSGGNGNDRLRGQEGDDTLDGDAGNDKVLGNSGADVVRGGPGNDHVLGGQGDDEVRGQADNDRASGGPGNDVVHGNAGDDRVSGDDGDDSLLGGQGTDSCDGGAGTDTATTCETTVGVP